MGRGRATALLVGLVLAWSGCAAVVVAGFLPWYDHEAAHGVWASAPGGTVARVGTWLLVVAATAVTGARTRRGLGAGWAGWRLVGPLVAAGLAAVVVWRLDGLDPLWALRAGGVVALCGAAGLVLGWVLLAVGTPRRGTSGAVPPADGLRRRAGWRGWVAATAAVVLLAGGGTVFGVAADRGVVDRSTAAALPRPADEEPARLDRVRWHVPLGAGDKLMAVARRSVVVGQRDGLRVLDAEDGSERWHYTRRYDRYALATVLVTTDESTLVAIYARQAAEGMLVVGLDAATGRGRWQWSADDDAGSRGAPTAPGGPGWVTTAATSGWRIADDALIHATALGNVSEARSYGLRTGRLNWKRDWPTPADGGDDCTRFVPPPDPLGGPGHVADGVLAVQLDCGKSTSIRGIGTDGRVRWNWRPPSSRWRLGYATCGDCFQARGNSRGAGPDRVVLLRARDGHVIYEGDEEDIHSPGPLPVLVGGTPMDGAFQDRVAFYPATAYTTAGDRDEPRIVAVPLSDGRQAKASPVRFPVPRARPTSLQAGPGVLIAETAATFSASGGGGGHALYAIG